MGFQNKIQLELDNEKQFSFVSEISFKVRGTEPENPFLIRLTHRPMSTVNKLSFFDFESNIRAHNSMNSFN